MRLVRRSSWIVLITFTLLAVGTAPAAAGGRWDPNDVRGPLDLRWIGAYALSGGRTKVTIEFWEPVTDRRLTRHFRLRVVEEGPYGRGHDLYRVEGEPGHLALGGLDDGRCDFAEGGPAMIRVSPTAIRFVFDFSGVSFDDVSWRGVTTAKPCYGAHVDAVGPALVT